MGILQTFGNWIAGLDRRALAIEAAPVTASSDGWTAVGTTGQANDRDWLELQGLYTDALEAWRKHPHARRIIDLTTDHVLGDGMKPVASGQIGRFINQFWNHRQNRMDLRLPSMVDELSRAGNLFVILFRNPGDGMSYVRIIPQSQIIKIVTAENDWETELEFHEMRGIGEPPRIWLSPDHPDSGAADAVMLHYAVNRPVGALWGDGDLAVVIPWLLRYARMLEDRVRLNWAARVFYWFVRVPKSAVQATRAKYNANQPPPGSIIVHDEGETWDMKTPNLGAGDAANDLQAVRMMISVGSGQPPHWHGDSMDVNLATATAMERAAVRHLKRRQLEVAELITDICYLAYMRAFALGGRRAMPSRDAIRIDVPDISRDDNALLAGAGGQLATAFNSLETALKTKSPTLRDKILRLYFQFIGEPLTDDEQIDITDELDDAAADTAAQLPLFPIAPDDSDVVDESAELAALIRGFNGNGHAIR